VRAREAALASLTFKYSISAGETVPAWSRASEARTRASTCSRSVMFLVCIALSVRDVYGLGCG
jgi:hypothetical protein